MLNTLIQQMDIPLTFCLFLLVVSVILLWIQRGQRIAKIGTTLCLVLLLIFSNRYIHSVILGKLESHYPALVVTKDSLPSLQGIHFIVVLGGMAHTNPNWPLTSQLGVTMLIRLIEGIQLHKQLPQTKLVLSGGSRYDVSDAEMMQKMALLLGVDPKNIILEKESNNTYEEAFFLKDLLRGKRFILVTSARHMPRAMALFQKMGLSPLPAPTGHIAITNDQQPFSPLIPRSANINSFSEMIYEYLGFLKARLANRL